MGLEEHLSKRIPSYGISVRLSKEEHGWLKNLTEKHGSTITQIVRALIRKEITEKTKEG